MSHTNGICTYNKLWLAKNLQGDAAQASHKTYTRKGSPAKVTTQSGEKCRVAAFAEVEMVVEAGGEVEDRDDPLDPGVEDDTGGRVEDNIEVGVNEEVGIWLLCADITEDGTGELNEPVMRSSEKLGENATNG